ncbi:hypothetical protein TNCV_1215631 [Trichonephila clavipes]|nr:hypothetical protein TNCV_1215631 [Trichonephila clavipes]
MDYQDYGETENIRLIDGEDKENRTYCELKKIVHVILLLVGDVPKANHPRLKDGCSGQRVN